MAGEHLELECLHEDYYFSENYIVYDSSWFLYIGLFDCLHGWRRIDN